MYFFVSWLGGRPEFATLEEAEQAAFVEAGEVISGKHAERLEGHTPSNLTICIFTRRDGHEARVGRVERARENYSFTSWSPASHGGGEHFDLSPEDYALILGHRRKWSPI